MKAARHWLGQLGLHRSMVVRWLTSRYGPAQLREFRDGALNGSGRGGRLGAAAVRWIEAGRLEVLSGRAGKLQLHMGPLTLAHAQLGAIAFGDLEPSVQEAMVRHLSPGGVLYDIGANVGFFSLLGARLVGRDGRVYAFEPVPENGDAVELNARLNGLDTISVTRRAVGRAAGRARLQIVRDASWSKLEQYGSHPEVTDVVEVDVVAIDDLVRAGELRPPTVVKVDVEGAELAVLEGMQETLAKHRPVLICELHDTQPEFVAAMVRQGYRVSNLDGPIPVQQTSGHLHALALPVGTPAERTPRLAPPSKDLRHPFRT